MTPHGKQSSSVEPTDQQALEQLAEDAIAQAGTGSVAADELIDADLVDTMMSRVGEAGVRLTGEGGFLPSLIKACLERGLEAELSDHVGYEKGDPAGRGAPNSRNGATSKTLATEVGQVELDTPRDRAGTFRPQLVPKRSRRMPGGLDEQIISLYAGGMTVRDISYHFERTLGVELSRETISKITDAVETEVRDWQQRPLDEVYPIVYIDALVNARLITGITLSMLVFLSLSGNYIAPYGTPIGQVLLGTFLAMYVGMLIWLRTMARGKPMPRFIGTSVRERAA